MRDWSGRMRCGAVSVTLAAGLTVLAAFSLAQTQTAGLNARQEFLKRLVAAAEERTHHTVRYDPAYVRIPYPGGDVPEDTGVCTDEVIRSYRAVGIDLQKEVQGTWRKTSPPIRGSAGGSPDVPTQIWITVACRI